MNRTKMMGENSRILYRHLQCHHLLWAYGRVRYQEILRAPETVWYLNAWELVGGLLSGRATILSNSHGLQGETQSGWKMRRQSCGDGYMRSFAKKAAKIC